jgi:RNA methyltransferase, TrmH family
MIKEHIDSAANKKIRLASSLHLKKYRDQENLFVAEGIRLVEMAAKGKDWIPAFGFYTAAAAEQSRAQAVLESIEELRCPMYEISEALYKKVANTVGPQGLLLVLHKRQRMLSELLSPGNVPFIVVADGIQDPGNAGTIIRTADAAGCSGVIFMENSVDVFSDKVVRSTMGSLFHLPIVTGISKQALLSFCGQEHIRLFASTLASKAKYYFCMDYTLPTAFIFGNEGNGISAELLSAAEEKVYIPMFGAAESLNVAMAASVVIYEALRQRMIQSYSQ